MKILLVHQNFPAQFKHLAPALVAQSYEVTALTLRKELPSMWNGVRIIQYTVARASTLGIHPWVSDTETKVIRGEAALRAAIQLRADGFQPDLIIAHPGWGESLFLKEVWPTAKLALYSEFFYCVEGGDVGFDPEFPCESPELENARTQMKNLNNLLHLQMADAGISPTRWQADTFPLPFRDKITVVHDGIDTHTLKPNPQVTLTLGNGVQLSRQDEVITFVNRTLEPYRGYHVFMRALPEILAHRPNARVLIVGGDEGGYGAKPPAGTTWREVFLREVQDSLPLSRIHFVGKLPYPQFIALLQLSTVHVYLTYPFVLSWSLLEAMSMGCAVVASDTQPVREVITHGETGRMVDFFDVKGLSDEVVKLLENPLECVRLGQNARHFVEQHYDLQRVCLPKQLQWVTGLLQPD